MMPPQAKITREMILNTVLDITRSTGFETVNARSIASRLQCSTRPIFTCYENMDELKKEFLDFAYDFYEQYVTNYKNTVNINSVLLLPLSYIGFAQEETYLFKLLFINDMDLDMEKANDFYKDIDNEKKAQTFSDAIGVELEHGKEMFLDLFFYTHGIAVLTATNKLSLARSDAEKMVINLLSVLIRKVKPDWVLPV